MGEAINFIELRIIMLKKNDTLFFFISDTCYFYLSGFYIICQSHYDLYINFLRDLILDSFTFHL